MSSSTSNDDRISEHESKIASLVTSVESLVGSFKADRDQRLLDDKTHREEMSSLTKAVNDGNKFPIANALTSLGLIVVMIGGFYALLSKDDARIEQSMKETSFRMEARSEKADFAQKEWILKAWDKLIDHTTDGHPEVQKEAIKSLKASVARVEIASVTNEKLTSELKAINHQLDSLKKDYEISRVWIDRHDQVVPVLNATQNTKDDNFEREFREVKRALVRDKSELNSKINKLHEIIGELYKSIIVRK